jgi:hypothetical protein
LEVAGQFVVPAGLFREEEGGVKSEVIADGNEAAWGLGGGGAGEGWEHGLEPREGDGDSAGAEEGSALEVLFEGEGGHGLRVRGWGGWRLLAEENGALNGGVNE